MRACLHIAIASLLLTLVTGGEVEAQSTREDLVKSAFIYNFIRFVEWPSEDSSNAFIIAVLGESGLLNPLREISRTKTLPENRRIEVRHWRSLEEVDRCNILFISGSMGNRLDAILGMVEGKNWLTVSDTEGFAARGIAINFVLIRESVKFEINRKAIERAGLRVSAQLLRLGILVDVKKREDV